MNWQPVIEIGGALVCCLSLVSAALILRKLDQAAKANQRPVQIWIVDLMCLMFMLQLPFAAFSYFEIVQFWGVPTVLSLGTALVWWTTVKTVSTGGINEFKWRAAISLFVIPMTYIGSFALIIVGINAWLGNFMQYNLTIGIAAIVGLVIGMVASNLIVIGAIKAVKPIAITEPLNE